MNFITTVLIRLLILFWYLGTSTGYPYGYEQSVSESEYQQRSEGWKRAGFHLVHVTGFEDEEGTTRYNTIWHKNDRNIDWTSYEGITEEAFQTSVEPNSTAIYTVFLDGFSVTDPTTGKLVPRINVIYHKRDEDSPSEVYAKVGQNSLQYQAYFNEMVSKGCMPEIVSTYQKDGEVRIASLFVKNDDGVDWISNHDMTRVQVALEFGAVSALGYSVKYASIGTVENKEPRVAAIYTKELGKSIRSPLPFMDQATLDGMMGYMTSYEGYMPAVIDAYKNAKGKERWMSILVDTWIDNIPEPEPNGDTFPETNCFDEAVIAFMVEHSIPGISTAVLKDGKIVYSQGYGIRDVPGFGEDHKPPLKVMPYTPMRIGSTSKVMTFLAVYRLIQQGSLSLADKVFGIGGILQFMSDTPKTCCPIVDSRIEDITILHLLSHQGGWDRDLAGDPLTNTSTIQSTLGIAGRHVDRNDVIYYMLGQPLQHAPGTTCAYSNFGYTILSRVIEVVTGKGYEQAARELFLDDSGVSRRESYLGSSLISEMPLEESEYYCPGCPTVDSCFDFTAFPEKVPFHCGGEPLETATGCGSWVSSAQQLVQLMAFTSEPHCNGTLASNKRTCLLWKSSVDTLTSGTGCVDITTLASEVMMTDDARYGHGIFVSGNENDLAWGHGGVYLGSLADLKREDSEYNHCAWAMISNALIDGIMDPVMKEAVACVGDKWPINFRVQTLGSQPETPSHETDTSVAYQNVFYLSHSLAGLVTVWLLFWLL